ncbi:MAG: sulfotransferase, partial [Thiomicrorhabdus sp.]|nr:sulfotransferase [Thiomicrorhabdus sp.]
MVNNVLVVGAPRSGTTLVGGLICEGEQSSPMLPECTYITQLIQHFYNIVHYSDSQRFSAYAIDESTLGGMYVNIVNEMVSAVCGHFEEGTYSHLVLKDPELTLYVDLIPRFFGADSKVVCVVRDPRAVVASMLKVLKAKASIGWADFRKSPNSITLSAVMQQYSDVRSVVSKVYNYYWCVHTSELFKSGRVHVVKYENIVLLDGGEFDSLERYLGFSVGRKGFGKLHFDFDRADATHSPGYGNVIKAPAPQFPHALSGSQLAKIESVFSGFNL